MCSRGVLLLNTLDRSGLLLGRGRVEAGHYTEDFEKEADRSIILAMLEINYCPYCGGKARKADDRDSYCEACDLTFYVVLPDEYRIED